MYDSFVLSLTQKQVRHQTRNAHTYIAQTPHHQPAGRRRRIEDRISMMLMVKRCAPVKRRWSTGTTSGASEESGPCLPLCQGDQLTPYGSQHRCKQGRNPHVSKSCQCRITIKDMLSKKTSLLKIDSFWFCQSDQQNTSEHFLREANLENIFKGTADPRH